jgi:hypothetical protein
MLRIDHIAVAAETLAEGVSVVEEALGVSLAAGGQHPLMATHNRLLGLGGLYLEVISVDPDAPAPDRPRWFNLDNFTGAPRLSNWIAACDDLDAMLAALPQDLGRPLSLSRGNLRWRMAVPDSGQLPFDDAFPALIQWEGSAHPAGRLQDSGLRLSRLEIAHPEAAAIRSALAPHLGDSRVVFTDGATKAMRAEFTGPDGTRVLE